MAKAMRVNAPFELEICELPIPGQLTDDEVLIRIKTEYPKIIEHELAGEIVNLGANVNGLQVGDHVSVDPVMRSGPVMPVQSAVITSAQQYNVSECMLREDLRNISFSPARMCSNFHRICKLKLIEDKPTETCKVVLTFN
jgi:threonine dehydrogenase-like Zn-dependent dehydrogenase